MKQPKVVRLKYTKKAWIKIEEKCFDAFVKSFSEKQDRVLKFINTANTFYDKDQIPAFNILQAHETP